MANLLYAFVIFCMIFFFGCLGLFGNPQVNEAQMPITPVENKTILQEPNPIIIFENQTNITNENKTNETMPLSNDSSPSQLCLITFQKDASSVYYIMAKSDFEGEITVQCPNGKMAEKIGGLFFCTQLEVSEPIKAYLDGLECASADFNTPVGGLIAVGKEKASCSLSLSHKRITKGETTAINVQSTSGSQEINLTFNCGDKEISQKRTGLVTDGAICQFNTPGTVEIFAKINGNLCDSEILQVFEKAKECSVSEKFTLKKLAKDNFLYTAKVSARGYSSNDLLTYSCFGVFYSKPVWQIPSSTDFVIDIECKGSTPLSGPVKVKVGGDSCGEVAP